ncbi:MAG: GNAT family N-acetyltransferase [Armatimonadetes bacterium]|nr:GNAT family N-acetyltransferase [Armatimonadota bacterium]
MKQQSDLLMRLPNLLNMPPVSAPYPVRQCQTDDAELLASLLDSAFEEHWTPKMACDRLLQADDVESVFIMIDSPQPIATASCRLMPEVFPDSGYVHWVAVTPAFQGRGLGRAITLQALHRFYELGCQDAVLETQDHRLAAIRTYLKLGFIPEMRDETHPERWDKILQELAAWSRE